MARSYDPTRDDRRGLERVGHQFFRRIIGAYHRCVTEIVEGFGGFVARYMGDGVLVYFGYPRAHEDDAERAIRCGLAVVEQVPRLNLACGTDAAPGA